MDIPTWALVVCTCVPAFALCATVGAIVYFVLRHNSRVLETSATLTSQHIDFSKRLMSRFCAASNIQAEAFVRQQEQLQETANEKNRLEEAGEVLEKRWLR